MKTVTAANRIAQAPRTRSAWKRRVVRNRYMYLMILPGLIYFLVFKYLPMWGLIISFQDYVPFQGILHSPWVGFKQFNRLFTDPDFWGIFRNTLSLFLLNIVFYTPVPIVLAIMLNEVAHPFFKRIVQTIVYIPHFLSWVIVVSISFVMLTLDGGIVNEMLRYFGFGEINFLLDSAYSRPLYILQTIWREAGWGTIVYLAAIASIDPGLYEAARMDGAGRFRQIWHITFPAIRSVVIVLLILRIGSVMDHSFEHVFLLINSMNRQVMDIFDTYVFTAGVQQGQYSYTTAVGFFKSFIGLALVMLSNWLARRFGEEGVY
ncbi:sugar ABC transporter permease [Paenibacillus aurantius]|uniref:Sugar ABC transporter permease n=1 Tax=Paenibacillus aurantius TaxID=2918900 RepID=A0AA96LIS3_9BACL|nr:sugar ABC transporter permease [Paenibacillus aurantius]WNQ12875.1 sugar ABC transporter permease [Paenibacillus aurantius]